MKSRNLKILVSPNAFKGTISAEAVGQSIIRGIKKISQEHTCKLIPVADGGDGTLDILISHFNGYYRYSLVTGAMGRKIEAKWGVIDNGKTAVIECANIYGLATVPEGERDPSKSTSYGIGELILEVIDLGIRNILIAVGGSANNDGGTGLLSALGYKFTNKEGVEIPRGGASLKELHNINSEYVDKKISGVKINVLSDSSVPIVGDKGLSLMYASGKGATQDMALELECALLNYCKVVQRFLNVEINQLPMSGSGGGVVSALQYFLSAEVHYGIDYIMHILKLEDEIKDSDLVITGEGQIDEQTIYSKAPIGVAKMAAKHNKFVLAVCAKTGENFEATYSHGINKILCPSKGIKEKEAREMVKESDIENMVALYMQYIMNGGSK